MYVNVSSTSDVYYFKTFNAGTSPAFRLVFFRIQGAVRNINTVSQNPAVPYANQAVTVTAELDGTFATGQSAYLRYTTDNYTTSTIVEMSGSGTTYTATIPGSANNPNANFSYYCFTSGNGLAANIANNEADWYTINLNNNAGTNYTYTVNASYGSTAGGSCTGLWSNGACWLNGSVPPASAAVTILENLTMDVSPTVSDITIAAGKTLTSQAGMGRTLTLNAGGTFTCNGTFTANDGTVAFSGAGTVSGTVVFNNVNIAGGGVNFGTASTLNGTLNLNSGGFVNGNAPTYAAGSTLRYNTSGNYGRRSEWDLKNPYHVQLSNNTLLDMGHDGGAGTARTMHGNLTVDAGSSFLMDFGSNDMTQPVTVEGNVVNNGTISLSDAVGGDLRVGGNFSQNGTFNCRGREVTFNGGAVQTLSGSMTGATNRFDFLRIHGAGVNLSANVEVDDRLALVSGNITLNNFNLVMNDNFATPLEGGSASSYVVTNGTGVLTRKNVGSTAKLFPVGPTTGYNPATLTNAGTVDDFSVRVGTSVTNPFTPMQMVNRQWEITEATSGGSDLTLTLVWNEGEAEGGFICSDPVVIGRYNGATWEETLASSKSCSAPFSATAPGFAAFSPFAVGNQSSPLPVEFLSFAATPSPAGIALEWRTATETNNDRFEVERSTDARHWQHIGTVPGGGTSLAEQSYHFTDHLPRPGLHYYRLKQVDYDGSFHYSRVVSARAEEVQGEPSIYPNPADDWLYISLPGQKTEGLVVTIFDRIGHIWIKQVLAGNALDISSLKPDLYFIVLENERGEVVFRGRFVKK